MKKTSNALRILDQITGDNPQIRELIEQEQLTLDIAHQIIQLRKAARLSQAALASRIGTSQSAVSRLEDADYDGHSLTMLRKIGIVLGASLEVRFVKPKVPKRLKSPYSAKN